MFIKVPRLSIAHCRLGPSSHCIQKGQPHSRHLSCSNKLLHPLPTRQLRHGLMLLSKPQEHMGKGRDECRKQEVRPNDDEGQIVYTGPLVLAVHSVKHNVIPVLQSQALEKSQQGRTEIIKVREAKVWVPKVIAANMLEAPNSRGTLKSFRGPTAVSDSISAQLRWIRDVDVPKGACVGDTLDERVLLQRSLRDCTPSSEGAPKEGHAHERIEEAKHQREVNDRHEERQALSDGLHDCNQRGHSPEVPEAKNKPERS